MPRAAWLGGIAIGIALAIGCSRGEPVRSDAPPPAAPEAARPDLDSMARSVREQLGTASETGAARPAAPPAQR